MTEDQEIRILKGVIQAQKERLQQLEAGLYPGITMGAAMIATERLRQIEAEGFSQELDQSQVGKLAGAAVCYLRESISQIGGNWHYEQPPDWPLDHAMWKPKVDVVLNLTRAGALVAAEIDRILYMREADRAKSIAARNDLDGQPAAGDASDPKVEARSASAGHARV